MSTAGPIDTTAPYTYYAFSDQTAFIMTDTIGIIAGDLTGAMGTGAAVITKAGGFGDVGTLARALRPPR